MTTNHLEDPVFHRYLPQTGLVTSSAVVNSLAVPTNEESASLKIGNKNYERFSIASLNISACSSVLNPEEVYDINRIMHKIDKTTLHNSPILPKIEYFLDTFRQFLRNVPSDLRKRLPVLAMTRDTDGDIVIIWATRKANAIFDFSESWEKSVWCATNSSNGEQKSESAPMLKNTILDVILKSYKILLAYV